MAFLDNYFSEVITWSSLHYICEPTVRFSSPGYMVEIPKNSTEIETSMRKDWCEGKADCISRKNYDSSSTAFEPLP